MNAICHCDNCKQRTGSAFGWSSYFKVEDVAGKTGEMLVFEHHHQQQNHDQKRYFCGHCGTTLYWEISTMPDKVGISGGCFTDNPLPEPLASASTNKKTCWFAVPKKWQVYD